jgi:hypothetical protein
MHVARRQVSGQARVSKADETRVIITNKYREAGQTSNVHVQRVEALESKRDVVGEREPFCERRPLGKPSTKRFYMLNIWFDKFYLPRRRTNSERGDNVQVTGRLGQSSERTRPTRNTAIWITCMQH